MTERIVMIEKDCVNKKLSGDINEVIRAVLSPLFIYFFLGKKILATPKAPKGQKAQKRNQAKAQNANKGTKIKNVLQKHLSGKKNLFPYLRFCVFCAREEKKIEKKKKSLYNVMY